MSDFCCDRLKELFKKKDKDSINEWFYLLSWGSCLECSFCRTNLSWHYFQEICDHHRDTCYSENKNETMTISEILDKAENKDYVKVATSFKEWPSLAACDRVERDYFNEDLEAPYRTFCIDAKQLKLMGDIVRAYKELVLTTASHVTNQIKNS